MTRKEDKQNSATQRSLVRFLPVVSSDEATLPFSRSLSREKPLSCYVSSLGIGGTAAATSGAKASKSSTTNCSKVESNLVSLKGDNSLLVPKKPLSFCTPAAVTGEGEDYFWSLFGDSMKLSSSTNNLEKTWKHFSTILDEVGHFRSSALGHIKIADVDSKGFFVKFINASHDKELDIGDHILQQKLNGQTVALYRFHPNIVMQANSTVTVWAAASEAKHRPPSDFLWKEKNKFRTSPNCTTILCKPNGEAIAWYTPIHWKQAWEKLETDIEFDRCSVITSTLEKTKFQLPMTTISIAKGKQAQEGKDTLLCHVGQVQAINREKEIPPTLFPTRSPWCNSPNSSGHPYCPLTELHNGCNTVRPWIMESRPGPDSYKSRELLLVEDKE
ncbi:lamin tail domain-containing protein 1 [Rhynchocyon petersi]